MRWELGSNTLTTVAPQARKTPCVPTPTDVRIRTERIRSHSPRRHATAARPVAFPLVCRGRADLLHEARLELLEPLEVVARLDPHLLALLRVQLVPLQLVREALEQALRLRLRAGGEAGRVCPTPGVSLNLGRSR